MPGSDDKTPPFERPGTRPVPPRDGGVNRPPPTDRPFDRPKKPQMMF